MSDLSTCPACGYTAPKYDGPTHAYMSPNAECWALYGEVLAREYSDADYWKSHRLLTDAYCAQHSISEDRRARQSVNIHLAGLMMHFQDNADEQTIIRFLKQAAGNTEFPLLEAPKASHGATIEEIHAASSAEEHAKAVAKYARAVFDDWQEHHGTIRALIEEVQQ